MIKVGIADDHLIVRKGLAMLVNSLEGVEVVFEAEDGQQLVEFMANGHADIVLVDIRMPKMDGIQCCRLLRSQHPNLKILVVSHVTDGKSIYQIMDSGANGFFSKGLKSDQLEVAIRGVREDEFYFGPDLGAAVRDALSWRKSNLAQQEIQFGITERELQIIKLACQEHSSMEIAGKLHINVRTVETHRKRIMEKTHCKNFIGVVLFALKQGYISVDEL